MVDWVLNTPPEKELICSSSFKPQFQINLRQHGNLTEQKKLSVFTKLKSDEEVTSNLIDKSLETLH